MVFSDQDDAAQRDLNAWTAMMSTVNGQACQWRQPQAGLVTTEKVGRVRTCKLGQRRLDEEAAWIER
jgi:hypothetical protein